MARIIEIAERVATVQLHPEDCLMLARACQEAALAFTGAAVGACENLGAMFEGLAMAAASHSYLVPGNEFTLALVRCVATPKGCESSYQD